MTYYRKIIIFVSPAFTAYTIAGDFNRRVCCVFCSLVITWVWSEMISSHDSDSTLLNLIRVKTVKMLAINTTLFIGYIN